MDIAWYCARTKPKHEHIAAANLIRQLGLEVFHPRLKLERATQRGVVRLVESLFPCYVFIRCTPKDWNSIRYVTGISSLVHFGDHIPTVPDCVISDLKACFDSEEPLPIQESFQPGSEVTVATGAFRGFQATVLRTLSSTRRVQVLLDILGRPTVVELDHFSISMENRNPAASMPLLAAAV